MTATDAVDTGPLLMTDPSLLRTAVTDDRTTYWNTATGQRFELGRIAGSLLEHLRVPQSRETLAGGDTEPWPTSVVDRLCGLGLLTASGSVAGPASVCPTPPAVGLFGCPGRSLVEAVNDPEVHAVAVGMPYDIGATGNPGSRFGPQALRGASRTVFRQRTPGDTSGMHDPVRGRNVLAGVGLADVGDISAADVHDRNGDTMDVLEQIVGSTAMAGKLPIVLGGDHSITLPAVRGVLGAQPRLGIIHFDAHPDYRRARDDDWRAASHHGNFMGWLLADPRVERLVQFGVRQLLAEEIVANDKVSVWPGVSAVGASLESILRGIPEDLPYYLTIDVDCLDPLVMPSTGTPLLGGFTHLELVDLVEGLCGARKIVGLDIVEYLPDGNLHSGHVAADVLLRALDSAVSGGSLGNSSPTGRR